MSALNAEPEYREGYPDLPGWYDVTINGVEARMVFRFCGTCGMFVWQDMNGIKAGQDDVVLWMPGSWDIRP